MRFIGLIFALLAALCLAQQQQNYINVPTTNFDATAGQPITITWQNPSASTVTIRLYQGGVAGPILISGIPASAQTATFTIPSNVNAAQYNFAIVDDSNPSNINYSSGFTIAGGTDTPTASASASATATATASASASASATATATASATASLSSLSSSASSVASSLSASASSASASLSSAASSASHSASSSASRASSSASAAATSVAASTNGCGMAFGVSGAAAFFAAVLAVY